MGKYLLGLDNGGTNIKAVIFDIDGNTVATAYEQVELITPGEGRTERDKEGTHVRGIKRKSTESKY